MVTDISKCEILKDKIKKLIDMTDYPIPPTILRYLGKVEIIQREIIQTLNDR